MQLARKSRAATVVCALLAAAAAQAADWPRQRGRGGPACEQAMQLATAQFRSVTFHLYAPPPVPSGFGSTPVLWITDIDISGGDAINHDAALFDKLAQAGDEAAEMEYLWANAAQRPWVAAEPYNTREQVDAALAAWARNGRSYRELHQRIQRQLPPAQHALADYYVDKLGRSREDASALAARVVDAAYRYSFVFPR